MINLGFWGKIKKPACAGRPIMVLAPMADVTDCVFRQIIAKYSAEPDAPPTERPFGRVFWTEFVSADGLAHPVAREKLLIDLKYGENEHPIISQIFGGKPENIREASKLCRELGFDGIDINMGCPDRSIEKQCAGAGMIKDPALAKAVIESAREGALDLPVSVKTRIGYNKNEIDTWIRFLLEMKLPLLTIHLRTRKEMSDVPAHWDLMPEIIKLRDEISPETLIFGNGDVLDIEDGKRKCEEFGCDGVMLGRAIFGNPWLFTSPPTPLLNKERGAEGGERFTQKEKLQVLVEHTKLFEKELGKYKNFAIMKKHFKAYVNGWPACAGRDGAKELRMKLMETNSAIEVENIVNDFLK